ncbi:MAG: hypothetical protein MR283_01450 [Erysipelotrichaceae bacterium]|nr:hypothetical protein [Erysipelotrichaceae bacterium]
MKKQIKYILTIFIVSLFLVGCGKKSLAEKTVGHYTLTKIITDNQPILEDELQNGDIGGYIVFSDDGTGSFVMINEKLDFTWKDGKLTAGNQTISYELDGDTLTLIISATEKMELTRDK